MFSLTCLCLISSQHLASFFCLSLEPPHARYGEKISEQAEEEEGIQYTVAYSCIQFTVAVPLFYLQHELHYGNGEDEPYGQDDDYEGVGDY